MRVARLEVQAKRRQARQSQRCVSLVLALALVVLLLPCAVHAQVLYGSLTGNVIDPTGAAIPGAKVEAVNTGTNVHSESVTDEHGIYRFNNIQAGLYTVTVSARAFASVSESNVQVSNDEVRRVDMQLQIAKTTETMEVRADAVVLQSDKADIEAQVTPQEIEELPVTGGEGKNFQRLLFLVPGAGIIASPEANSEAGNPMRAITLFMNGVSSTGNNTKLDGTAISYPWLPVNVAYVPPPEAIQSVDVSTNDFDAEQGAAGGVATNVTIKSGTNQLHGVAYENNQNQDLAAVNNVFSHPGRLGKNIFNNYGFALGGPIWIPKVVHGKNKLFFFLDYMATKRRLYASDTNLTLPTSAMRTGDFSATPATIYNPFSGNADGTGRIPFAGNKIPGSMINSAAQILTNQLPALTRPNAYTSNYDAYGGTQYNRGNWDYKVNYNPTDKTMVWGRYSFSPINIVAPFVLGADEGDAFGGGNPINAGGLVQTTATGFTATISPTLLVDGNVGYTRQSIGANGDEAVGDFGTNTLKIPGTNGTGVDYQGIPGFQVSGVANMGNTNTGSPFKFRDNQYTTAINLTKVKGSHNLRFGFEYDRFALNQFQPQGGTFGTARGTFGFDGTLTALNGGAAVANPYNSWAQFLLGLPSHTGKITQVENPNSLRFSVWSAYARDQWQATKNLTVSYGLRWEYYPIFSHAIYGATRFDPSTDDILIGGEGGVPWDAGATASKKGFAPRFGLAYRLGSKTVARGGFGITVDPDNMRNQRNAFPSIINEDYTPPKSYQFISYAGVPNSDGATQVSLSDGLPLPTAPALSTGTFKPATTASPTTYLPSVGTVTFPAYMDRGYYESWNLTLQHQFSPTLVAQAAYVGTHGVHVMEGVNINGSAPGTGNAGRQLYPYVTSDMNMYEPFGDMTYNALQTQLRKSIGSSIIGVNYVFSKAIDEANGDNGDATLFRAFPTSYNLNKQLAGFDRAQTFQIFYVYQLPFGKGHSMFNHGAAAWIIGGWELSGNLSWYTGLPFTIGTSSQINAGGQGATANQVLSNVAILGGIGANSPWFNGAAFANPPNGVLGTTGRDILFGPGLFNLDQSLSRIFSFKEGRVTFQLRGDAFNLTNTPTFSNPNATCCWLTNATTGAVNYNNYAVITGTASSPRQLQVGGYLRF
ncbi:MAG: carboxypeptidase regulatory-like domain-containing protein [Bryobacteraceae bacterium]